MLCEDKLEDELLALRWDDVLSGLPLLREQVRSVKLVTTTDGFQGQEAQLVIASTVRSAPRLSPFQSDYRRVNVALSRSSQALLIVGSHDAMSRAKMAGKWAAAAGGSGGGATAAAPGNLIAEFGLAAVEAGAVLTMGERSGGSAHRGRRHWRR